MIVTDIDAGEWDAYVENHPDATGYHSWRWRTVFREVFGHHCEYLAIRRQGRVSGVLPLVFLNTWLFGRYGISVPFVNYGGVLADDSSAADELLEAAAAVAARRGLTHLELRHRTRQYPHLPAKQHKVTMLLELASTSDAMWNRLDRKVRNQIRKAEKAGLQCVQGGEELLDEFYVVFTHNMRDLGIPVHSRRFFQAVLNYFPKRARVCVVRRGQQPVGAAVTYAYRNVVEVPWASSLKDYLALCPNNLLYWTIIRDAISARAATLDFGRSTPDEGTFHFKRQWGALPSQLYWEYRLLSMDSLPEVNPKNPRYRMAIDAWKHLPLKMATLLGPPIVRGMPY